MAKATVELGDILATTDNPIITSSVYTDELTVTYDVPVPQKTIPTPEDLFQSDLFTFGSIIGSITNKGTSAYALLPNIIEEYGADSPEAKILESRLDQCCVAQSKQIDELFVSARSNTRQQTR